MSLPVAQSNTDKSTLLVLEPATGNVIEELAISTGAEVRHAVEQAQQAQGAWTEQTIEARTRWLLAWRRQIINSGDELAHLISRENGKPLHEAWLFEIVPLCDTLGWLAENACPILSDNELTPRWMKHQRSLIRSKPRGVSAVISPYNLPLLIPFADAAAALVAGCSVIIKPSELTPLIAREVARLAVSCGLPSNLLHVLVGGAEVARDLIACEVHEVLFTGNRCNGREVARQCADRLIPCTLELGGRAPAIVLEEVDIDRTAAAIVFGALANSGQNCIAIERVFASSRIRQRLVDALVDRVRRLRQGNATVSEVDLGALTSAKHLVEVERQVSTAIAAGAQLTAGGRRGPHEGNYYVPTILQECHTDMTIVTDETFGPVIPIVSVDSLDSAVNMSNHGVPSLAAYLFGRNDDLLLQAARRINASHVLINDVLWSYVCPEIPFGGGSHNGWGVTHGPAGLLSHTSPVHLGRTRVRIPAALGMGFPYARSTRNLVKRALKLLIH